MQTPLRIVYFGTPDFAVASLDILVKNGYEIVGVVTAPDKPAGRGKKIQESAVKKYAVEHELNVLQPSNLKSEEFISELKSLNANLQIVVAFRMLPEAVWNMPEIGTFNLHGSLLPQYRGAAPINWAVINGEKETGVTTFFLKHEIDTGNVIFQDKISISENDNAGIVHDKLMAIGAELVLKTVKAIEEGNYSTIDQAKLAEGELKHAPKIFKDTCRINWNDSTVNIYNHIRGLSPYPAAWTEIEIDGAPISIKIYEASKEFNNHNHEAGNMIIDSNELKFSTNDGYINVLSLQLAGKKRMNTKDFLLGFKPTETIKAV